MVTKNVKNNSEIGKTLSRCISKKRSDEIFMTRPKNQVYVNINLFPRFKIFTKQKIHEASPDSKKESTFDIKPYNIISII